MKKVLITSNSKNKGKKVREGFVFGDSNSLVDEIIIQNPKRAGATKVDVFAEGDTIIISDNGSGCAKPKVLFTLDESGFGGEGFGEGFSIIYMFADYFEVRTLDWKGSLNVKEVLDENKGEFEVQISDALNYKNGFEVEIRGERVKEKLVDLMEYIENAAALVPNIDFTLNGKEIKKRSIFDVINYSRYVKEFRNRKYEGKLSLVESYSNSYIKIYYEYRFVCEISFYGLNGTILLKPKAVNLRTPDRRDIVRDSKMWDLKDQLRKDVKTLIKEMIRNGESTEMKKYSDIVDNYMSVDEYMPYLMIDAESILNQFEMREISQEDKVESKPSNSFALTDSDVSVVVSVVSSVSTNSDEIYYEPNATGTYGAAAIGGNSISANHQIRNETSQLSLFERNSAEADSQDEVFVEEAEAVYVEEPKRDTKRIKQDKKMTSYVTGHKKDNSFIKKSEMGKVSIKNIKSKKNVIWVEKDKVDEFSTLIDKYEYYGVFTFVSPHLLFDNALKHIGIPHISSLEEQAIKKEYNVKKIGARTKKEERAMELFGYIEKIVGVGETFNISTIECKMIVQLRDTKIYQERLIIGGYAQGNQIHINRKHIDFGGLSSLQLGKNSLSIHDVKFILGNLDVIAHELSHLKYDTEDNTKRHYEKQIYIQNNIAKAVMTAKNLW